MILLGYHLRVCLLCSVLGLAVKCSAGTKDDRRGSPKGKPPWGIRDVNPVPQTEAFRNFGFFQRESFPKPELVDFASIYQTHKAKWSSSKTGSAKAINPSQTETGHTVYKAGMNPITQPSPARIDAANFHNAKAEANGVSQDRTALTFPSEGFAMILGQLFPSEAGEASVHPLQSELSTRQSLRSEASMQRNANILFQQAEMDSTSPKIFNFPQMNHGYSQIEPSPHTYTTEDHSREVYVDFSSFARAQEDSGVSRAVSLGGYARSTLKFLKPQAKPVAQKPKSTDDLSTSVPSTVKFNSSLLLSTNKTSKGIKPAASHFRSQQAWQASAHRQRSGILQHGSGPLPVPKYSGMSRTITRPGKRRKSGVGGNKSVKFDTLSSNQATRSLTQRAIGKFEPFQVKRPREPWSFIH